MGGVREYLVYVLAPPTTSARGGASDPLGCLFGPYGKVLNLGLACDGEEKLRQNR